jgi:hypothetical protein
MRSIIVVIIKRDHHSQPRLFSMDRDLHYHSFHYTLNWRPKYLHKIQKGTAPRNGGGNEWYAIYCSRRPSFNPADSTTSLFNG